MVTSSRAKVWRLIVVVALVLAMAGTGCSGGQGKADRSNTIIVGLQAEPTALDPAQISDYNSSRATMEMYDSLLRFKDGSTELEPGLAETWSISDDGLKYTLNIRKGVTFHDGTPLNAEAVVFNIQRQIDVNHPYHNTGDFPYAEFTFGKVAKIEATGDYTVVITLKERYAPFLANLAMHSAAMVSPTAIKKYGKDIAKNPVGTGPFKFVSWNPGVEIVVQRNPDYWRTKVKVERIVYRPILEDQTRLAELEAGSVDFIVNIPPDDVARLKKDDRFTVAEQAGNHIWYLVMNCSKPPFNNLKVRQAANYAIDRKAIVDNILKGTGVLAENYIPPVLWTYDNTVKAYPYDPEKAKALLKEAGVKLPLKVDFWVPSSGSGMQQPTAMAAAIQADLAKVGIEAKISTYEWGTYLNMVFTDKPQDVAPLHEMSWAGDNGDPDNFLYILNSGLQWPSNGFNEAFFKDEALDKILVEAQQTNDRARREVLYKEAQKLVMADAPWVPIDHETQIVAMAKRIKGFVLHPTGVFRFDNVEIAK